MSLEAAIKELTEVLVEVRDQNKVIVEMANKRIAEGAGDAGKKPAATKKTTPKGKDETTDDASGNTKETLVAAFKTWLGEFGEPGAHPESAARHTLMKQTLGKLLGEGKNFKDLAEDDQTNIDKLQNWLETKAKTVDKGFGGGRLVADPAAADDEDDGLGV